MSGPLGFPLAGFSPSGSFINFLLAEHPTNLQLVFDPGDIGCFASASAQTIDDLKGTGDAFMGSDATSEGIDPSFVGNAGALETEYWRFQSAASERCDWQAQPTVLQNFCKQAQGSSICLMFYQDAAALEELISQKRLGAQNGFRIFIGSGRNVVLRGSNNGADTLVFQTTVLTNVAAWNFIGWGNDESGGAAASFININGTVETFDGDCGTGSNNPSFITRLGVAGDLGANFFDGRIGPLAAWDTNLSQADMEAIRQRLILRYAP